jgi:hypothetical protein
MATRGGAEAQERSTSIQYKIQWTGVAIAEKQIDI